MTFGFSKSSDLQNVPRRLESYIRKYNDIDANFDAVVRQVAALFGTGTDASVSNTRSHKWVFGLAQVQVTIWPPKLNSSVQNTRHEKIPGSQTESYVTIDPAYCIPITDAERASLQSYQPLCAHDLGAWSPFSFPRTVRRVEHHYPPGTGIDKTETYLIRIGQAGLVQLIPIDWLTEMVYDEIKPAKGGGGISLFCRYRLPGHHHDKRFSIIWSSYELGAHRDLAERLSERLSLPLTCNKFFDV